MDFLDPKKQRAHTIRILVGYVLIAIALVLTTIILLYQAYGFGVDSSGKVIQNGLVFMSSTPNPATIYVNGKQNPNNTNARLLLTSGQYTFSLQRTGYREWKRAVTVEGGSVERFDYPFLIPNSLQTSSVKSYDKPVQLATESPDRRWLLAQNASAENKFDIYDLSKPKDVTKTIKTITIPDNAFTATDAGAAQGWQLAQWSTDNRHVVLKHTFQKAGQSSSEYVLLDTQDTTKSLNLTTEWGTNPTSIELRNQAYDQYYLYDQASGALTTASLKDPVPQPYLTNVLASKSYGTDVMLYVTTQGAPAGKALVKWHQGTDTYTIRTIPTSSQYLVNLTQYSGDWYVAAGSSSEGKVYVYKNPVDMLKNQQITVPVRVLKVADPNYVAFSSNARFIMTENANHFSVYDVQNDKGYTYTSPATMDAPQVHATWMDGDRITYISDGKVVIADFDGTNRQTLVAGSASFLPFFDRGYTYLYTIDSPTAAGDVLVQKTALRTPNDL
ncbi:MAG: PEGA domain-containing protein [Candidatus Saccharibacteria bacterium]